MLRKKMEGKLIVFENKVLRKVSGQMEEIGEYCRKKNAEIRELYNEVHVVNGRI